MVNSLLIFVLNTCAIAVFGQGSGRPAPPITNTIIPPAPTAAALGKFADIPVGFYTGKPQITIPLWTITAGKLALPISLDYNAGGIKVEEISSWVGLGWSLNAGGVITRAVRGVPDEGTPGIYGAWGLYNQYIIRPTGGYTQADHSQFYDYATGKADSQPDLYYYNFNGKSGKFITTNSQQEVQLTPYQNLRVQPQAAGWKILAEDGTRYEFQHAETSTYSSITYTTSHGSGASSPQPQRYTSSWFLSRIISATNDTITFKYTDYNLPTYTIASSETKYARLNPATNTHEVATTVADGYTVNAMTLEYGKRLRRIEFANGAVDFIIGAGRCDLPGDSLLAQVVVRQQQPGATAMAIVKTVDLEQRYLVNGDLLAPIQLPGCSPIADPLGQNLGYRPMLTAVTEHNGTLHKPPYQFEYIVNNRENGKALPYRAPVSNTTGNPFAQGYCAQDHWGYYNGQNTNTTLVPPLKTTYITSETLNLPGANRAPDLVYARIGSLTKITYPTGGSTSFEWELHDFVPPRDLHLTPPTRDNTWSYSTRLAGSILEPFVINDELNHEAIVAIQIENRFPCACLGDNSFYDACGVFNNCRVWFKIINDDTGTSPYIYSALSGTGLTPSPSSPTSVTITLPNGHYHVEHHHEVVDRMNNSRPAEYEPNPAMPYGMTMTWQETINVPFDQGGGLRIAKMVDYDPVAERRTTKTYDYRQSGVTSGTLISVPVYTYPFKEDIIQKDFAGERDVYYYTNLYTARTANSQNSLGSTQGSSVGYGLVTEYYQAEGRGLGSAGKTEHYYTSGESYADSYLRGGQFASSYQFPSFPFAPTDSRDWQRGLLTTQIDFRWDGGAYQPVKRMDNTYRFYSADNSTGLSNLNTYGRAVMGVKVGVSYRHYGVTMSPEEYRDLNSSSDPIAYQYFTTSSGYAELATTTTRLYDPLATQVHRTTTTYEYGVQHLLPQEVYQGTSSGDSLLTRFRYPDNFQTGSSGGTPEVVALRQLQVTHQATALVEKQQWRIPRGATDWQLLSGTLTKFKTVPAAPGAASATLIVPAETQVLETTTPLVGANQAAVSNGSLVYNDHYRKRETFDAYTTSGKLRQHSQVPRQATVYLWGYRQQYPIAEVRNATYAEVVAVLGQTTIDQLASANPGSDQAVQQALQPLRTQLKRAQVLTYTYNPLVGLTSQTDPTGRTVTYEYDALGRLLRTRDDQGRILSQQQYHYAGK